MTLQQAPTNDFRDWFKAHGRWSDNQAKCVRYEGFAGDRDAALLVAPPEQALTRGEISATVRLDGAPADSQARIVIGRDPFEEAYVSAGIGGHNAHHVIEVWEPRFRHQRPLAVSDTPPPNWPPIETLTVRIQGRKLSLRSGKVEVLAATIPRPVRPEEQVGLFAWGDGPIIFESFKVDRESPCVFVAMPAKGHAQTLSDVIDPLAKIAEVKLAVRAHHPGSIIAQINREILESDVVVAEVTEGNQNVLYEMGYAAALKKPIVQVAKIGTELPFDRKVYRCVFYKDSPKERQSAAGRLRESVLAAIEKPVDDDDE